MSSVVLITKTNSLRGQVTLPAAHLQWPILLKYSQDGVNWLWAEAHIVALVNSLQDKNVTFTQNPINYY